MKKKIIIIVILFLLLLLIPIPIRLKDGGTVEYRSILYKVSKVKSLKNTDNDYGYIRGIRIYILNKKIYDNTKYVVTDKYETIEIGDSNLKKYIDAEFRKLDLIDKGKIKSFRITKIINHGYYESNNEINYYQINFEFSCKNKLSDCVYKFKTFSDTPNSHYENNSGIIWATFKNDKLIEFKEGFSTTIDSDFKVLEQELYVMKKENRRID